MEFVLWIIVGALAGWIASIMMSTNKQQNMLMNIIVGIIGAFIGGFIVNLFGVPSVSGFNVWSIVVAILGAVILLWLYKIVAYK